MKSYDVFTADDRRLSSRLFRAALKRGDYETPQKNTCSACGQTQGQIEWHREDYSTLDPKTIVTLCCRCHRMVHLRDRYPEGWKRYRWAIRRGYRWPATKAIGQIIQENALKLRLSTASLSNQPQQHTTLDVVDSGVLMLDTPEERRTRMDQLAS